MQAKWKGHWKIKKKFNVAVLFLLVHYKGEEKYYDNIFVCAGKGIFTGTGGVIKSWGS